jgi:hypothetical protein
VDSSDRTTPCRSDTLLWLLILLLIHPPLRQAEWRHSSGERARSAVRRSRTHREEVQRSKPEAMSPDGCRSEGTPSPGEGPDAWGEPFGSFWLSRHSGRLPKGTRRKGETISRRYRSNGYVHQQEQGRQTNRHREQARSHRGLCTPEKAASAIRPPSLASQLPQGSCTPTNRDQLHHCQREQARSHNGRHNLLS